MVKTRELTDFERGKVIGLYKAGESERAISEKTGYGKTTIHNIISKYNEMGAISVASRSGRPKKLTLYEMGYNSRTALRKPLVSEHNRKIRLNWAREKRSWTIDNWKNVVWSDESRFTLYQNDGKIRV